MCNPLRGFLCFEIFAFLLSSTRFNFGHIANVKVRLISFQKPNGAKFCLRCPTRAVWVIQHIFHIMQASIFETIVFLAAFCTNVNHKMFKNEHSSTFLWSNFLKCSTYLEIAYIQTKLLRHRKL